MKTIVINTGTELLLGDVLNSHLSFIAREIFPLGLRVLRQLSVPDGPAIRAALAESSAQADIIFVTGGLGPTTDDITREITAELLGLELRHDAVVMAAITARAASRGFRLTDRTPRQAEVPEGATVLPNENGSAPGLYLAANSGPKTNRRIYFFCQARRASCNRCSRVRCCRSSVKLFRKNLRSIAGLIASRGWANPSWKKQSESACSKSAELSSVIVRAQERLTCESSANVRLWIKRKRSLRQGWARRFSPATAEALQKLS